MTAPFKVPDMSEFPALWSKFGHDGRNAYREAEKFYEMGLAHASSNSPIDPKAAGYLVCRKGKIVVNWKGTTSMPEGAVWPIYREIGAADIRELNKTIEPQSDQNDALEAENAALRLRIAEYEAQLGILAGKTAEEQDALDAAAIEAERVSFELWACTSKDAFWFMRTNAPEKMKAHRTKDGYSFAGIGEESTAIFNNQYKTWMARSQFTNHRIQKALIDQAVNQSVKQAGAEQGNDAENLSDWQLERHQLLRSFGNAINDQQAVIKGMYAELSKRAQSKFKLTMNGVLDHALKVENLIDLSDHEKNYGPQCISSAHRYTSCSHCSGYEAVLGLKWQLYTTQQSLIALTGNPVSFKESRVQMDSAVVPNTPHWWQIWTVENTESISQPH